MSESAGPAELVSDLTAEIQRHRDYLHMLARFELRGGPRGRFDESDVVNQTLFEAHRDRKQFRGATRAELVAWLRRILSNTIGQGYRRDRAGGRDIRREVPLWSHVGESSVQLARALAAPGASPSEVADGNEQVVRLASALARLPDDQREAVELRYLHGLAVKAIADRMKRTTPAVGGLIHRGLVGLRKDLTGKSE